ncbi:cytochrome c [Pseudomonas sp. ZM23]|uniref:Cytochrome c n=1 Tax=Pseudomonas triclosanedens TaxID=2961893 RepID=A0ABY6ZS55_9PSED|nr:cytochrome c [Pseudomonas triclosanedens]MCP8467110.1 cytochrome c [Pseudomonas triclosanedens]MCP8472741.1 cytochrome c [Pseudomonas triclosanedens]MCP8478172.1 cytochrome c [Pseudomonas triclosanedens]WAI47578.1 cytochrome c [Pseudomonas triclosanedens]
MPCIPSRGVRRILPASLALVLTGIGLPALADGDGQWHGGANVYAKVCGHCHEAGVGPVIKGRQLPVEYISAIVRHGFRAMPAFPAAYIDDDALKSVAQYIQQSAAPAQAAR